MPGRRKASETDVQTGESSTPVCEDWPPHVEPTPERDSVHDVHVCPCLLPRDTRGVGSKGHTCK